MSKQNREKNKIPVHKRPQVQQSKGEVIKMYNGMKTRTQKAEGERTALRKILVILMDNYEIKEVEFTLKEIADAKDFRLLHFNTKDKDTEEPGLKLYLNDKKIFDKKSEEPAPEETK